MGWCYTAVSLRTHLSVPQWSLRTQTVMSPHLCTISTSPEGANTHCCIRLNDRCPHSDNSTKGFLVTSLLSAINRNVCVPFFPSVPLQNASCHINGQVCTRAKMHNSSLFIDFIKAQEILLVYLSQSLQHRPVDICHLEFVCIKEIVFIEAPLQDLHFSQAAKKYC